MNCCDEYGNCRQGRDCPVRKTHQVSEQDGTFWILFTFVAINVFLVVMGVWKLVELFFYGVTLR